MRRKIILHGPSTLSVSLPSSWVKKNNIQKGDEIDVLEQGENLLFKHSTEEQVMQTKDMNVSGLTKEVRKDIILSLYKNGYDEIKIIYDKPSVAKEIINYINKMHLGFEVMKQEEEYIILRNISSPKEDIFENLFRRIFRLCIEYAMKISSVIEYQETITETYFLHQESIFRIANFCERTLLKAKKEKSQFKYQIVQGLKNVTSIFSRLLECMEEIDYKHSVDFEPIIEECITELDLIYKTYYKFSLEDYTSLKKFHTQLGKKISSFQASHNEYSCYRDFLNQFNLAIEQFFPALLSMNM